MKLPLFLSVFFCSVLLYTVAPAQVWRWAKGSSCPHGLLEGAAITVDKWSNVYEVLVINHTTGSTDSLLCTFGPLTTLDSANAGHQAGLVSLDSNGNYRWALVTQRGQAYLFNVAADTFGNIYAQGNCASGHFALGDHYFSGGIDFCAKIDTGGHVIWIRRIPPAAYMSISKSGNLYITSAFASATFTVGSTVLTNASPGQLDVFFAKLDSSATPVWAKSFGGNGTDYMTGIALTDDDNIYISGTYTSTSVAFGPDTLTGTGVTRSYVAKFDTVGSPLWARSHSDSALNITNIATDRIGNLYLTGARQSSTTVFGTDSLPVGTGAILAKYDLMGNAQWVKAHSNFVIGVSVAVKGCDNIWVSGQAPNIVNDQMYLAEYNSSGILVDSMFLASGGDDANIVALDNNGNLYVGGDYTLYTPFIVGHDTLNITDSTVETLFALKYHFDTSTALCVPPIFTTNTNLPVAESVITLFPNPAYDECTIQTSGYFPDASTADIYDVSGRRISSYKLSGSTTTVSVANLRTGIYFCSINIPGKGTFNRRLAVMR